jgi:hypothetical protein
VDLTPGDIAAPELYDLKWTTSFDHIPPFHNPNSETIVIHSLGLEEYHEICYWNLGRWQTFPVSMQAELHLGAVVYSPSGSELDGLVEIAFLPDANLYIGRWSDNRAVGDTMEDDWTRCTFHSCLDLSLANHVKLLKLQLSRDIRHHYRLMGTSEPW